MNINGLFNDIENDNDIDSDFIKYLLWYSPSTQSYLKPKQSKIMAKRFRLYNEYLEYSIKKIFSLSDIIIEQNNENDWIRYKKIVNDILYINKNPSRVNLLNELIEGIRNAVAHGAIKIDGKYLICMSQYKPEIDSSINFFIKVKCKLICDNLERLVDNYNNIDDEFDYKLFCVFNIYDKKIISTLNVKYNNVVYTIKVHHNNVILKKDDVVKLINYKFSRKTLYLVNNTTNYDYEKFKNNNKNLEIMKIDVFFNKVVSNEIVIK